MIGFVTPGPQFGVNHCRYWLWKRYKLPGHSALLSVGMDRFLSSGSTSLCFKWPCLH